MRGLRFTLIVVVICVVKVSKTAVFANTNERQACADDPGCFLFSKADRTVFSSLNVSQWIGPKPALASDKADVGTLKLLHVMYRHGDRNPISTYRNDPFKDPKLWPKGFGQLTNIGKMMEFNLGLYLRNRYENFLNDSYRYDEVRVRSTDVDRTLMSAQTCLAGLYPPINPGDQWNVNIKWQPIPVHTVPATEDWLSMESECPRYNLEEQRALNSTEVRIALQKYRLLLKYLTEKTGQKISTPKEVSYLYDTLYIERLKNFTLPNWTEKVFPDDMRFLSYLSFIIIGFNKEMRRLRGGPLLGEITNQMRDKASNELRPVERKAFFYSAHDTTLSAFMMSMGAYNGIPPPYASAVLVELHKSENEDYFVKTFYRNDTESLYELKLQGCDEPCSLDQWSSIALPLYPKKWTKECNDLTSKDLAFSYDPYGITLGAAILAGILVMVLVAAILLGILLYHTKNETGIYQCHYERGSKQVSNSQRRRTLRSIKVVKEDACAIGDGDVPSNESASLLIN